MFELLLNAIPPEPVDHNMVPAMTSNNTPVGYVISADSSFSSTQPYMTFARDTLPESNKWFTNRQAAANGDVTNCWIMAQLPTAMVIKRYAIKGDSNHGPISYQLQGSNNGSTFTNLHTLTNRLLSDLGRLKEYNISSNTTAYRYYRINITKINSPYQFARIDRLYFYDK